MPAHPPTPSPPWPLSHTPHCRLRPSLPFYTPKPLTHHHPFLAQSPVFQQSPHLDIALLQSKRISRSGSEDGSESSDEGNAGNDKEQKAGKQQKDGQDHAADSSSQEESQEDKDEAEHKPDKKAEDTADVKQTEEDDKDDQVTAIPRTVLFTVVQS